MRTLSESLPTTETNGLAAHQVRATDRSGTKVPAEPSCLIATKPAYLGSSNMILPHDVLAPGTFRIEQSGATRKFGLRGRLRFERLVFRSNLLS